MYKNIYYINFIFIINVYKLYKYVHNSFVNWIFIISSILPLDDGIFENLQFCITISESEIYISTVKLKDIL